MVEQETHPILFLVSAPSGAGKTTLCRRLLADEPQLRYSVSVTTRSPREGEVDGVDYVFTDRERFLQRVHEGDFLEYAEVHGNFYGTSRTQVEGLLEQGYSVLLDVDVQGARQIRKQLSEETSGKNLSSSFVDVFIAPPGMDSLRSRLEGRGQDDLEIIERRLKNAELEMEDAPLYAHKVINDDLETAYSEFRSLYRSCRQNDLA